MCFKCLNFFFILDHYQVFISVYDRIFLSSHFTKVLKNIIISLFFNDHQSVNPGVCVLCNIKIVLPSAEWSELSVVTLLLCRGLVGERNWCATRDQCSWLGCLRSSFMVGSSDYVESIIFRVNAV